jgi:ABC-type dipeptide/oligopeptide/nickel transport system permease component
MVTAVRARDIPLVMGIVVISTIAVWAGNAVADILQLLNDKRLRDAEILPE